MIKGTRSNGHLRMRRRPRELSLKYTSTPEEFEAARLALHKEAAEVLGVDWNEYCGMNNLAI
jgi:Family of unknown function (DUF6388)